MMRIVLALILATAAYSQSTLAEEEKPLWEYGIGVAGLYTPHYLGADQYHGLLLPAPFFIYRGDTLKADRDGVRGSLFNNDRLKLNISGSAALPVDSEDNDARTGMSDLDFILELGPTAQFKLFNNDQHLLRFDLPVRAAFTLGTDFFDHQGWTANPRFHHQTKINGWQITSTLGAVFSDRNYHAYFYDVDQDDVRSNRPFYQSEAGFSAMRFSTGIKRYFNDFFVGTLFSYTDLNSAANENSPLLKRSNNITASFIVAWVFGESKERAPR